MYYVGLDVHRDTSFCAIMDKAGNTIAERNLHNDVLEFANFFAHFDQPMEAAMEATTDAYFIEALLTELGITVRLAHPAKLRLIAESSSKTDRSDAHLIADMLRMGRLPEAYLAPAEVRQLRELTRGRQSLVHTRTRLKNQISALLRRYGHKPSVKDKFGKAGRTWMQSLQLPTMAAMLLDIYLAVIDVISAYVSECDNKLRELSRRDERIQRLQEIPGIAQVFGPMIIAEIGEISRFWSKRRFVAYCGLAPIVRQSADKTYTGPLRRDCNHWLRYAFIEATHSCVKSPGRYRDYYQRKAEQRNKKVATVATARRLCRLVFALLWSDEHYQSDHAHAA